MERCDDQTVKRRVRQSAEFGFCPGSNRKISVVFEKAVMGPAFLRRSKWKASSPLLHLGSSDDRKVSEFVSCKMPWGTMGGGSGDVKEILGPHAVGSSAGGQTADSHVTEAGLAVAPALEGAGSLLTEGVPQHLLASQGSQSGAPDRRAYWKLIHSRFWSLDVQGQAWARSASPAACRGS